MSVDPLQQAMLELMDVLSGEIISTEAIADELTKAAVALSANQRGAEAIRYTAVRKRVQAIELRGKLAALREEYATRLLPET